MRTYFVLVIEVVLTKFIILIQSLYNEHNVSRQVLMLQSYTRLCEPHTLNMYR